MKKILFFEKSPALQKAFKYLFSNENLYSIKIADTKETLDTFLKDSIFDLLVAHVSDFFLNGKMIFKKASWLNENILLIREKDDEIGFFQDESFVNFIEKPFSVFNFKNKVDFLLGIDEQEKIKASSSPSHRVELYLRDSLEKWLNENASHLAREVIREEILKLIN